MKVVEVIRSPKGEVVLDMGQNFTGYLSFESGLPKGNKDSIRSR